jgi:hypothetical protein
LVGEEDNPDEAVIRLMKQLLTAKRKKILEQNKLKLNDAV